MSKFKRRDPKELLYSKLVKDEGTGCWNWVGCLFPAGYGYFKCVALNGRTAMSASRASWIIHKGDPGKLFVCHTCDNRLCCNPDHLFLGTSSDNMIDCSNKGRISRGEDRPQSKLTEADVRRIRRLYNLGIGHKTLAKEYSMGKNVIWSVVKRITWKHVV